MILWLISFTIQPLLYFSTYVSLLLSVCYIQKHYDSGITGLVLCCPLTFCPTCKEAGTADHNILSKSATPAVFDPIVHARRPSSIVYCLYPIVLRCSYEQCQNRRAVDSRTNFSQKYTTRAISSYEVSPL